ncbi:hypothetical protein JNUCC1_01660 [Lentibacillus sp. JNUCC-1]|uniref:DUF2399 domain-containing protein n=1 Tax=Lentibacillus sp. JNUCC-1 TaxID=2654513 RepID=UPI0013226568|nr:DUF2399 domain-containing protein [Lentibacillus sp. JNUCC-1]MUV37854.1 hypothetical protein [Lentibacillus sp. JNUCC-1]
MLDEWLGYIAEYILLKNEELSMIDMKQDNGVVYISVIKRTARTRRVVARFSFGLASVAPVPPDALVKAFASPKVKKRFAASEETFDWIRNGWIIREYRFEKDERTVKSEQYRMGLALFKHLQRLEIERAEVQARLILDWRSRWEKTEKVSHTTGSLRSLALRTLENELETIAGGVQNISPGNGGVEQLNWIIASWRFQKQMSFLHFLLALYQIACEEEIFDWKQIGARYYRKIGGSKEFDVHKKEFIEEAEQLLQRPLHLYGLATLGTITPIFFTGEMHGGNVSYHHGSVHATTDLAVFTDSFQTEAEVLWLVENRGVLTRMAYEKDFLINSKSLVLGIDGQIRSAHRRLITQLAPHVKQVIIWTDVDEAGLTIAREAAGILVKEGITTKWVVPPLEIVTTLEQFEQRYIQSIQINTEEQEQEIGGVQHWKTWIKH